MRLLAGILAASGHAKHSEGTDIAATPGKGNSDPTRLDKICRPLAQNRRMVGNGLHSTIIAHTHGPRLRHKTRPL